MGTCQDSRILSSPRNTNGPFLDRNNATHSVGSNLLRTGSYSGDNNGLETRKWRVCVRHRCSRNRPFRHNSRGRSDSTLARMGLAPDRTMSVERTPFHESPFAKHAPRLCSHAALSQQSMPQQYGLSGGQQPAPSPSGQHVFPEAQHT